MAKALLDSYWLECLRPNWIETQDSKERSFVAVVVAAAVRLLDWRPRQQPKMDSLRTSSMGCRHLKMQRQRLAVAEIDWRPMPVADRLRPRQQRPDWPAGQATRRFWSLQTNVEMWAL